MQNIYRIEYSFPCFLRTSSMREVQKKIMSVNTSAFSIFSIPQRCIILQNTQESYLQRWGSDLADSTTFRTYVLCYLQHFQYAAALADLGVEIAGGAHSLHIPPKMTCGAFKICLLHQSVTAFLSHALTPKKYPGSASNLSSLSLKLLFPQLDRKIHQKIQTSLAKL